MRDLERLVALGFTAFDAADIYPGVEARLGALRRRLGVACLDLVQFHWWDFEIPGWLETARWLSELQEKGYLDAVGLTNFDARRQGEVVRAGVGVVSNQVQYSLLDRRPERALVEACRRSEVSLLGYGVLAGGFLTDRWLDRPGVAAVILGAAHADHGRDNRRVFEVELDPEDRERAAGLPRGPARGSRGIVTGCDSPRR